MDDGSIVNDPNKEVPQSVQYSLDTNYEKRYLSKIDFGGKLTYTYPNPAQAT
jgi:hypothetical protein